MPKGSPEKTAARKEEIINACEQLYQTMSFKEITLKEIGKVTSFTRTSIYNYFQTKEEIFLALFEREYERWNEDLSSILETEETLSRTQLADQIAASLSRRPQLLKLLAMNNYDMEASSRPELLTSFKKSYGRSMELMGKIIRKNCADMKEADVQTLIYVFFPFMFGIYPYAEVTLKQKTAMAEAGIGYVYQSVYELTDSCLKRLLSND